ncbi:MAG: cyclodeaminase/cyclohydrolase family protein [Firmicutes bacterium]|nr:cyclodeaminase/cyclohydrolase family protein [Bacillota bacterium]
MRNDDSPGGAGVQVVPGYYKALQDFSVALASETPTPGGGSAAAAAGMMGAALVAMSLRVSYRGQDIPPEVARLVQRAEAYRVSLGAKAPQDAAAYERYLSARRMPRHTAEEQERRQEALASALREATAVPLTVAEGCLGVLEVARDALEWVADRALSDLAAAAEVAAAGLASAAWNVRINLRGLPQDETSRVWNLRCQELSAAGREALNAIRAQVEHRFHGQELPREAVQKV